MKKMLIVTNNPYKLGGLERVTIDFANMMETGYKVDILCVDKNISVDYSLYGLSSQVDTIIDRNVQKDFSPNIFIKGVRFLNKKLLGITSISFLESIYTKCCNYNSLIKIINDGSYDLVVALQMKLSIILGSISSELKCKTIGWQHNSYEAYFNTRHNYYWNQHKLASKYLNLLNNCIVLTQEDAKNYKKYLGVEATCIYDPVRIGGSSRINSDNPYILWVGRLEWQQKGLEHLLRIGELLKKKQSNIRILVVGNGKDSHLLKKEIERRHLQSNVILEGYSKNVVEYYKKASVLISTSNWEGFGLTLVEGMSYGVPIVAFDNTGPREIIAESLSGYLIRKNDFERFAHYTYKLFTNSGENKVMSQNAVKRSKDFSYASIRNKWIEIIED